MRRVFGWVRQLEAVVLSSAMLCLAAVTIWSVLARNIGGEGLAAAEELSQFLIVVICFVGLSYGAGRGRHIRMTALYDALPRAPRKAVMILITGGTALLLFTFAWFAARYALGVERTSPVLGIPLRLVYAVAPLGLGLGGLQYMLALARNLTSPGIYVAYDVEDGHDSSPRDAGPRVEGSARP